MTPGQVEAVETRLKFLKVSNGLRSDRELLGRYIDVMKDKFPPDSTRLELELATLNLLRFIERGDTYFMDRYFMEMVWAAYREVPPDLVFEPSWAQSKCGWLYLDQPIKFHAEATTEICAIGWEVVDPRTTKIADRNGNTVKIDEGHLAMPILCYEKIAGGIPMPVQASSIEIGASYVTNLSRIDGSSLASDKRNGDYNECFTRWVFTAFHLMAQRLTVIKPEGLDRAMTRRLSREHDVEHIPLLRVVTLRRLEEERNKSLERGEVNWHWRWSVRGHWRNQFFPSDGTHKQIFVDSYIKGPTDKPFKPSGLKVFAAIR